MKVLLCAVLLLTACDPRADCTRHGGVYFFQGETVQCGAFDCPKPVYGFCRYPGPKAEIETADAVDAGQ